MELQTVKDNFSKRAEKTNFKILSFDLITVVQAVNWFCLFAFFEEVKRVSKPETIVAFSGYNMVKISQEVENVINHFYHNIIGQYWSAERKLVDESYQSLFFPFNEIFVPSFKIKPDCSLNKILVYILSWSAVAKYSKINGRRRLHLIEKVLIAAFGNIPLKPVSFNIFVRLGKIN